MGGQVTEHVTELNQDEATWKSSTGDPQASEHTCFSPPWHLSLRKSGKGPMKDETGESVLFKKMEVPT